MSIDNHIYQYRCPSCPTMVEVEWWDGNGTVAQDPKVRCNNPQCENQAGRMNLHNTVKHD